MENFTYIIFGTVFLVFGILLYIPCLWLVKCKTRNIDQESSFMLRITSSGLALCTLMTVALILGFARGQISPESNFGIFISSWSGKFYYMILIFASFEIFGIILEKLGFTLFRRHDNDDE